MIGPTPVAGLERPPDWPLGDVLGTRGTLGPSSVSLARAAETCILSPKSSLLLLAHPSRFVFPLERLWMELKPETQR